MSLTKYLKRKLGRLKSPNVSPVFEYSIAAAKRRVFDHLNAIYGGVVAYGPFAGMVLNEDSWWGGYDVISKILGEYEAHVVDRLLSLSREVDGPFIDVGAADGYFAIGMARLEKFERVIAFEKSAEGRQSLSRAVALNECEGMVDIACELTLFEVDERLGADERALVLIDIEGSEYDLLTSAMLTKLRNSYVLVELHPFELENGIAREQRLIERAHDHFEIEFFIRESYCPNKFSELAAFDDDERLLALSEGRASNMRWMLMSPK